ncbi:T5orf172 domain-containing protein [Cladophialophora immunda]|nr:T5orf172 domain-containing protein [Cladophialophora immunda]
MLPVHIRLTAANNNLLVNGVPQTPDRSAGSQTALLEQAALQRKQKKKTTAVIRGIRATLCATAANEGYIYATHNRTNGLVKVGYGGISSLDRPTDMAKCKFDPGRIFETPNFRGAFRAEKIVHGLLSQWNKEVECTRCINKHKEYFDCGLGFAISTIDVVTTWLLKEPYLIEGETGSLKDNWKEALDIFERSQDSDEPMDWFEFFLNDVESQLAWRWRNSLSRAPMLTSLAEHPVQLLQNGTLRFASKKRTPQKTPNGSPAVPQTSSATRKVRQRDLSEPALPRRPESAPPKGSSTWDQSPSPPETPSKPPKPVTRSSAKAAKTNSSSRLRSKKRQEDNSEEDENAAVKEEDEEGNDLEDEDGREHVSVAELEDSGLAAAISKLALAEGWKSSRVFFRDLSIDFESLQDPKSGRKSINIAVRRSSGATVGLSSRSRR